MFPVVFHACHDLIKLALSHFGTRQATKPAPVYCLLATLKCLDEPGRVGALFRLVTDSARNAMAGVGYVEYTRPSTTVYGGCRTELHQQVCPRRHTQRSVIVHLSILHHLIFYMTVTYAKHSHWCLNVHHRSKRGTSSTNDDAFSAFCLGGSFSSHQFIDKAPQSLSPTRSRRCPVTQKMFDLAEVVKTDNTNNQLRKAISQRRCR